MADTNLTIKDTSGNLVPIDVRTTPDGDRRQVVLLGDGEAAGLLSPATEATLAAILTELGQKIEAGQAIALDAPTLAALETIQANTGLDLSALATAAKQDTQATKLDTLHTDLGKIAGAASAVSYGSGTTNQAPVAPADATGRLMGYAIRETTGTQGATAQVKFRSGTTVSGTPLGSGVTLVANESVREWFGPAGITVPTAVFLERISGNTEVTVYWAAP